MGSVYYYIHQKIAVVTPTHCGIKMLMSLYDVNILG